MSRVDDMHWSDQADCLRERDADYQGLLDNHSRMKISTGQALAGEEADE